MEDFILKRITELRIKKNISEKQMSRDLGKSSTYLSSMINNKNIPSTRVLITICEYLEITMADFFTVDYEQPIIINQITRQLKKCSEEDLQIIASLANKLADNHTEK